MNLQELFDQQSKLSPNKSYAPTQEHRENNAEKNKQRPGPNAGKTFSAEYRLKLSQAKLGKKREPHSAETKAKMRLAAKNRLHTAETKAKLSKKIQTPLGVFASKKDACLAYSISTVTMGTWLKNKTQEFYYL